VTRNASGTIKRVNAAVVVNNGQTIDAKGKKTAVPLTSDEIEKLTALVKESIGFKQERGDSVKVINAPFKIDTTTGTAPTEAPWWRAPDTLDLVRAAAFPAALAIVAVLVFFGLVKPGMRAALGPKAPTHPGTRLDAIADDSHSLPALPAPAAVRTGQHIESARQMARANPAAVAGILRNWVDGSETAAPAR
jgi:flagellar M-ring protein FliF